MWEPRRLTILWASTICYTVSFTFFTFIKYAGYTKWNRKMIQSGELEIVTKETVVYYFKIFQCFTEKTERNYKIKSLGIFCTPAEAWTLYNPNIYFKLTLRKVFSRNAALGWNASCRKGEDHYQRLWNLSRVQQKAGSRPAPLSPSLHAKSHVIWNSSE
jgi:hypothetical protein